MYSYDFDKEELTSSGEQGLNPITLARFMELINNLYYDKEDPIVSKEDVTESLSEALEWLDSERERTGKSTLRQF